MSAIEWRSAPWTAVEDALARDAMVLLPVGAMEAHGPHLSNDADTVIAVAVARRAAELLEERGETVVILPALECSVCHAGGPFPGTISFEAELVSALIAGVCREVVRHGGRRFCINIHHWDRPHLAAVDVAVEEIRSWDDITCGVFNRHSLSDDDVRERFHEADGSGICHGGRVETSMVLASEPTHVREERLAGLEPVWINLMSRMQAGAGDFRQAGAEGAYFGDPASARADEGTEMIDFLAHGLVRAAGVA